MKKMIALSFALISFVSLAQTPYYPTEFKKQIANHELIDRELKDELFNILSSPHTRLEKGDDILECREKLGRCFKHSAVGYGAARKHLYTNLHVQSDSRGKFLKEVYCERVELVPISEANINCEHTWPQSKFNKAFNNELQKSDLHHLFPTDSKANSVRGNFEFAEVVSNLNLKNCPASKSGASVTSGGNNYFEPPTEHKGNVARALFYFSVRYKMAISNEQQAFLRKWNEQDPVDDAEMARNDEIEKLQGDRNPFIDFPHLANDISKF